MSAKASHPSADSAASPEVVVLELQDDGTFPNNARLPALIYRGAFPASPVEDVERCFHAHGWTNGWRNGVYDCHHYHSEAHEVLGCYAGSATVQLGGPDGPIVEVHTGDVVVIPAGVAHKRIEARADFKVVGCYAGGRDYDMNYGKPAERPRADANIARVPLPECDPVHGTRGPLLEQWRAR